MEISTSTGPSLDENTLTLDKLRAAVDKLGLPPPRLFVSPALYRRIEREAPEMLPQVRASQLVAGNEILELPRSWLPPGF